MNDRLPLLDSPPAYLRHRLAQAKAVPRLGPGIVHLGSFDHERWAVQREVLAISEGETSVVEAIQAGLSGRDVVCWHYGFWKNIPPARKRGARALCFFHHHLLEGFGDPDIVAAVCMNNTVQRMLQRLQPHKPVWRVHVGGAAHALAHARRDHPSDKIRLLLAGNAQASTGGQPRKGAEIVPLIARQLDPARHAWVLVGPGWGRHTEHLRARGWTVITPGGFLPSPGHYRYLGEGDIYLMLSRLEGGPLTLLETMGLGLWPICTRTGLAPDLIDPGVNGHVLPAYTGDNAEAIAAEVAALILTLDRTRLNTAKPRVRQAVSQHNHERFRQDMAEAIGASF